MLTVHKSIRIPRGHVLVRRMSLHTNLFLLQIDTRQVKPPQTALKPLSNLLFILSIFRRAVKFRPVFLLLQIFPFRGLDRGGRTAQPEDPNLGERLSWPQE